MYLFYIDESGDTGHIGDRSVGLRQALFTLTAVSLFDLRWRGFERTLNGAKSSFIEAIYRSTGQRLHLHQCEIKSTSVRIPEKRRQHPFLSHLSEAEITRLIELYHRQLEHNNMLLFTVVIDKRELPEYYDADKLHRKGWELLVERIQSYLQTIIIAIRASWCATTSARSRIHRSR